MYAVLYGLEGFDEKSGTLPATLIPTNKVQRATLNGQAVKPEMLAFCLHIDTCSGRLYIVGWPQSIAITCDRKLACLEMGDAVQHSSQMSNDILHDLVTHLGYLTAV